MLASVVDASGAIVNTDGGTGGRAGADGRYVFGYNVNLGSGTKQNTQFQSYTGESVSGSEIYSANPYLGGTWTPNIAGLAGGGEAFGLLPYSADEVFTDDILYGAAPDNVALAAVRIDGGWGYDYAGYDMILIVNLSSVDWADPMLSIGAGDLVPAVPMVEGGWRYDTRFGGTGVDPALESLVSGAVYATLIPDGQEYEEALLTLGAEVVGGADRAASFSIADGEVVYLTNSLVVPIAAADPDGTVISADASVDSVVVETVGGELVLTPEPGYTGHFDVDVLVNDAAAAGESDAGRGASTRFSVTVGNAAVVGVGYDDVNGNDVYDAGVDPTVEGAKLLIDLNDNGQTDAGEVFLSGADGTFEIPGLAVGEETTVEETVIAYAADMETDPGWTLEGGPNGWAYGTPAGVGGDPASGSTGDNVIGFNLSGQYDNDISRTCATTPAIDITGLEDLTLTFDRWLGVETSWYDDAGVEFSVDGGPWRTIYANPSYSFQDTSWNTYTYDIPAVGSTLSLRWFLETDSSVVYSGWNIDDVAVRGTRTTVLSPNTEYVVSAYNTDPPVARTVPVDEGEIVDIAHLTVPSDQPPTVELGADLVVEEGDPVQLTGSVDFHDAGATFEYHWTVVDASGTPVADADATTPDVFDFTPTDDDTYTVTLWVDGEAKTAYPLRRRRRSPS